MFCKSIDLRHTYRVIQFGPLTSGFDGYWENQVGWYFDLMCTHCSWIKSKKLDRTIPKSELASYVIGKGWRWDYPKETTSSLIKYPAKE